MNKPTTLDAPDCPVEVVNFQRLFEAYLACNAQIADLTAGLNALEAEIFPRADPWQRPFHSWQPADSDRAILAKTEDLVSEVVRLAEGSLLAGGGSLSIDRSGLAPLYREPDPRDPRGHTARLIPDFSLVELWRHLAQAYGGDRGQHLARQQAADAFVQAFGLTRNAAMQRQKTGVKLVRSVYCEKCGGASGRQYLAGSEDRDVMRACDSLLGCLAVMTGNWASEIYALNQMRDFAHHVAGRWVEGFESRTQFSGGQVRLTLFYTKLDVLLGHDLADALSDLCGEYGTALAA